MNRGKHIVVVGLRAGDEGKGIRALHYIQRTVNNLPGGDRFGRVLTYRWNGGANAGHTAVVNGTTYKLHQIPSGILLPNTYNLQASGVYVNPRAEVTEIKQLGSQGVQVTSDNLGIASNAFVTLDFHVEEDQADLLKAQHTSTGQGIRPTARDKYDRVGMRFTEFLDASTFAEILRDDLRRRPSTAGRFKSKDLSALVDSYAEEREFLAPYCRLESEVFNSKFNRGIVGEGANGFAIDVEHGLYPGTSSSHIAHVVHRPDSIVGVMKLYDSSVGSDRPFVGRMRDGAREGKLQNAWEERGTTTGKPRSLGWLDIVAAKQAIDTMDVDYLAVTCGDRLADLHDRGESVKMVVGYALDGKTHTEWHRSFHKRSTLFKAEPVLEEFDSWPWFAHEGKIHDNAQRYLHRIQQLTRRTIVLVGTGPGLDDVIELQDILA